MAVVEPALSMRIGGVQYVGAWTGRAPVAIDKVSIDWGTDDLYTDEEAAVLTATLLAANADDAFGKTWIAQQIVVADSRATGTTVFRGRISDAEITEARIMNDDGSRQTVWKVTLTAHDPRAELSAIRLVGTDALSRADPDDRRGFSDPDTGRMFRAGMNKVIDAVLDTGGQPAGLRRTVSNGEQPDNPMDFYTMDIRSFYPLATNTYRPSQNDLQAAQMAAGTDTITLGDNGNGIGLVITSFDPAYVPIPLDAGHCQIARNPTFPSPVATVVSEVLVKTWGTAYGSEESPAGSGTYYQKPPPLVDRSFAVTGATGGRRITIDTFWKVNSAAAIANRWLPVIRAINGRYTHPPVTIDCRRDDTKTYVTTEGLWDRLLRFRRQSARHYFIGSKYSGIPNLGPAYQVSGGTAEWNKHGWRITLRPAPAPSPTAGMLSLTSLFGDATTWGSLDPALRWSDLDLPSKGTA